MYETKHQRSQKNVFNRKCIFHVYIFVQCSHLLNFGLSLKLCFACHLKIKLPYQEIFQYVQIISKMFFYNKLPELISTTMDQTNAQRLRQETRELSVLPSSQISLFLLTLMRNNKLPLSEGTWHRIAVQHHPIIITFFILIQVGTQCECPHNYSDSSPPELLVSSAQCDSTGGLAIIPDISSYPFERKCLK